MHEHVLPFDSTAEDIFSYLIAVNVEMRCLPHFSRKVVGCHFRRNLYVAFYRLCLVMMVSYSILLTLLSLSAGRIHRPEAYASCRWGSSTVLLPEVDSLDGLEQ